jgi:hypothetical protein
MINNFKKLIAYSSSAATFLLTNSDSRAQVVYHNIDPDFMINDNGSIAINFNDDGINDIQINEDFSFDLTFWTDGTMVWFGEISVYLNGFSAVVANTGGYPSSYGAKDLDSGFLIGNSAAWNTLDSINLFKAWSYLSSAYGYYFNWYDSNKYLGVKFQIAGETHFGWIRLSIENIGLEDGLRYYYLAVQDYAYEATPNIPISIVNPTASIATNLVLTDVTDHQNASDFKLSFHKAEDESTISAYRVFLFKCLFGSPAIPTMALLETLSPDRYFEIIPTGLSEYELTLPETMYDTEGSGILTGEPYYYRAIVLSIADGLMVTQNNVSLPSNYELNELVPVVGAFNVSLNESGDNCDITDFEITFHRAYDESNIAEYRVYIVNNDHDLVSVGDTSYYQSVSPNGAPNYTLSMDINKKIYEDSEPILFQNYYAEIMTIGDSVHATIADFASSKFYETYYGNTEGDEEEFYCSLYPHTPVISFTDITKTAADIQVQFNGPQKINQLSEYRIFIVPEEDITNFTVAEAKQIPSTNYFKIIIPQKRINVNLPSDLPDIHGDLIALEKSYVVVIALIDKSEPAKLSLSYPSEIFNFLTDEGNLPIPYTYIYEDNLYVISTGDLPFSLNMYNMAGQLIMDYNITSALTVINLMDFPKGVYLIKSKPTNELPVTKVFIGH